MNVTNQTALSHCSGACGGGQGIYYGCVCSCATGFFGADCQYNVITSYPTAWLALSIAFGVLMLIIMPVRWLVAFYCQIKKYMDRKSEVRYDNRSALTAIISGFIYFTGTPLLLIIDPIGYRSRFWVVGIWQALATLYGHVYLGILVVVVITFGHHVEKYLDVQGKMRKMGNPNMKDKDKVKVEEITASLNKIYKFKVPFIICVCLMAATLLGVVISSILYSPLNYYLVLLNLVVGLLIYIGYAVVMIIYSIKLKKLFTRDDALGRKFQTMCKVLVFYAIFCFLINLFFIALGLALVSGSSLLIEYPLIIATQIFITYPVQSLFIDWSEVPMFSTLSGMTTDNNGSRYESSYVHSGTDSAPMEDTSGRQTPIEQSFDLTPIEQSDDLRPIQQSNEMTPIEQSIDLDPSSMEPPSL